MRNVTMPFWFLVLFFFSSVPAISATAELSLNGYYKNLLVNSKTLSMFGSSEPYQLDLNRLRLELTGSVNDIFSIDVQYDNEILLGNYLQTTEFSSLLKNRQPDTWFDLDGNYVDNENAYGGQSFYRAYADIALPDVDLRVGRQRIAWGTAMLWNPMDILNPFSPIQLERQEREGIDAVLMDWSYNALSRLSLVYAKQKSGSSVATRWSTNQQGVDISLMAGRFRDDKIVGFDFAGQLSGAGVRGEVTQTSPLIGAAYTQAVIGADYTFANTFSVNVEIYYNGQGAVNPVAYEFPRLLAGQIQSLARRYVGTYLGYDITPLLLWRNYVIINLDDDSYFFSPNLIYSMTDNVEASVGLQAFRGDNSTEFGGLSDLGIFQLQWYF